MAKLLIHTGKEKEKVEITPCVCGRMLHLKGATQCVQCGNGLKRKLTFPIKIFCWFWKRQFEEKEEIARMEKRPVFTKPNPPKAMDIVEEITGIEKRLAFTKNGLIYPQDARLSYPLPPTTSNPPMPPVKPPIKPKEKKLKNNGARIEINTNNVQEAVMIMDSLFKTLNRIEEILRSLNYKNEVKITADTETTDVTKIRLKIGTEEFII